MDRDKGRTADSRNGKNDVQSVRGKEKEREVQKIYLKQRRECCTKREEDREEKMMKLLLNEGC